VCVLHAVLGFVTLFSRGQQLVPKWIMVNSWGRDRFTFVMANPSMVWPQLAPGLAWLLWFALRGPGWKRTFPIAGAVILSAAIISTRQRGGLLLLGLLWGAAGAMWIWPALSTRGVKRSARILGLSALLVASCAVAVSLMTWPRLMDGTFHDLSRLSIWNIALHAWLQHDPVWGFGYASWHSTFLKAVAGTKDMFLLRPTAHNLWVQLAFEHGLVGFFMITSLMLSIVAIVLRNVNLKPLERELVFLQLIAFLTCTLVQEVDFVRPVLVTFAVTWGTLLGLRPRYAGPTRGVYQESISVSSIRRTTLCWSVSGLAVCALAVVLACSAWFAHGAFAFEPDSEVRDSLTRSVGKTATIPVFGPAKFWLFDTQLPRNQGLVAFANAAGSPLRLTVNQDENAYLPLAGGNRFVPKRHRLDISPALEEGRREISARIVYPPRTAPDLLPLLVTKSASQPVQQGTKSWIECASTCAIALDAELLDGFVPALEMVGTGVHEVRAPVLWGIRFEDSSDVRLPALSFAELRFDFNGSLSNVDGARLILPNHYVRSTSTKWVLLVVHNPIQAGPPDNRVVRVSLMRD
jgi:hypothetical protein